jgi:DNA-binding LacI/PurR family transcriptional regulator
VSRLGYHLQRSCLMKNRARTLADIARLAGVSKATVSRVIHSPHLVAPKTLERIQELMVAHSYVYDAQAAEFTKRKRSVVGLIVPTVTNSIHAALIQGIQDRCNEHDLSLFIGNTDYSPERENKFLQLFLERRVLGILQAGVMTPDSWTILREAWSHGIPGVVLWENCSEGEFSCVGIDNYGASAMMTRYLLELGHRKLGLIVGPVSKLKRIRDRRLGFCDTLRAEGIAVSPDMVVETEHSMRKGYEAAKRLFATPQKPTAIFAASDVIAFGALSYLTEEGIRVPEDVSLVGFDDLEFAAFCNPPLTTIHVPAYEMGYEGAGELVRLVSDSAEGAQSLCLDTDLVVRKSAIALPDTRGTFSQEPNLARAGASGPIRE